MKASNDLEFFAFKDHIEEKRRSNRDIIRILS